MQPEYRQHLIGDVKNAIKKHQSTDVEHPINHLQNGQRRWIRAAGSYFNNSTGQALKYSGIITGVPSTS